MQKGKEQTLENIVSEFLGLFNEEDTSNLHQVVINALRHDTDQNNELYSNVLFFIERYKEFYQKTKLLQNVNLQLN